MPMRWFRAKGDSATLAKVIRFYNLETGNRVSATYLEEATNIRYGRVERASTFKYRGKPRRLFIRNARIRYGNLFVPSFSPWFDQDW